LRGTHGDQFIFIRGGGGEIEALITAHKAGVALLPPPPASPPRH
jgi:hypothetical protein